MQRTRFNRRQLITFLFSFLIVALLVLFDQLSKKHFVNLNQKENLAFNNKKVFGDFFYFTFLYNTGSAYGMLSNKAWAQTFFAVITPIAVLIFALGLIYATKKDYKFLGVAIILIISGTIGNYVDRITMGKVVDFLCIQIFGERIFGIFNIADVYLSVGMVMTIIHLLFMDKNAIFGKNNAKSKD